MTSSNDELLNELRTEREIARVIALCARASDRKDLPMMRSCYHDDAVDNHGLFNGPVDDYFRWAEGHHEQFAMFMHLLSAPLIEVRGESAFAETYCIVAQSLKQQPVYNGQVAPLSLVGCRYLDHFQRRDGAWKILERNVVFEWTRSEWTNMTVAGLEAPGTPLTFGRRSQEDALYTLYSGFLTEHGTPLLD
jgi:SnoaL-like domain